MKLSSEQLMARVGVISRKLGATKINAVYHDLPLGGWSASLEHPQLGTMKVGMLVTRVPLRKPVYGHRSAKEFTAWAQVCGEGKQRFCGSRPRVGAILELAEEQIQRAM